MGTLRERARQLKQKRPGYGSILDFYVKVREAQLASKASLKVGFLRARKERGTNPSGNGLSLIGKEAFPVDVEAAIDLFQVLCRIAKTANTHLAEEVKKIEKASNRADLESLLLGRPGEQTAGNGAADGGGLDRQVVAFLIRNSLGPSIERVMEQLSKEIEPETWRKHHCTVCGSRPGLNLLKGEGGNLIPCVPIVVVNGGSTVCPVLSAATANRDLSVISMPREMMPAVSTCAMHATIMSRRSIAVTLKHPIFPSRTSGPSISTSWPSREDIRDLFPTRGLTDKQGTV